MKLSRGKINKIRKAKKQSVIKGGKVKRRETKNKTFRRKGGSNIRYKSIRRKSPKRRFRGGRINDPAGQESAIPVQQPIAPQDNLAQQPALLDNLVQQPVAPQGNPLQQPIAPQDNLVQQPALLDNLVQQPALLDNLVQQPGAPQGNPLQQPIAPQDNLVQQPALLDNLVQQPAQQDNLVQQQVVPQDNLVQQQVVPQDNLVQKPAPLQSAMANNIQPETVSRPPQFRGNSLTSGIMNTALDPGQSTPYIPVAPLEPYPFPNTSEEEMPINQSANNNQNVPSEQNAQVNHVEQSTCPPAPSLVLTFNTKTGGLNSVTGSLPTNTAGQEATSLVQASSNNDEQKPNQNKQGGYRNKTLKKRKYKRRKSSKN